MILQVGDTAIPYAVRFSDRATRKRVEVTTDGVAVVVPVGTPLQGSDGIVEYVHRKRRWVFDAVREVEARHERLLAQRYASGAKLQYKGRWLMLEVEPADVDHVEIACRSRFHVRVPRALDGVGRHEAIQKAFDVWLRDRALHDARRYARHHARTLGVEPKDVRLGDQRRSWGTCGKDGVIRVHWRLVQAPAAAMEYVVAHELTHLLHRNHSDAFWATLARAMPDWDQCERMLARWEADHRAV